MSNWADLTRRVYRHKRTGIVVPCHPAKTEAAKASLDHLKDYLEAEFANDVIDEAEFKETLALIFSKVPKHGLMFLLQITEAARRPDGEETPYPQRRKFNRWCAEVAARFINVRLVRVADFIHDGTEILNHNNTHFDRRVYHRIYLHIMEEARVDLILSTEMQSS